MGWTSNNPMLPEANAANLLKVNIRLYVQGCMMASTLALIIISFHIISRFTSTKWGLFTATTVVWEIAHVFDGFIALAFNVHLQCGVFKLCGARPTKSGAANAASDRSDNEGKK
ncbi:hypothetical protein ANCCAN_00646 [Ancylostoma caninum]|uniref:7TM GPCR serpentine receptor class x (Srx) domain-containing protein n=1 Tax=Ancylostoma caninum TaxID=29170 RepID=A0A368HCZ1_ANCCA|nr:hypothetical protein ANCCAN_00646 [Ancylostoma caninum]